MLPPRGDLPWIQSPLLWSPWSPIGGGDRLSYLIQSRDHSWRRCSFSSMVEDPFSARLVFQAQQLITPHLDLSRSCQFFFISSFEKAGGSNFLFFFLFPSLTESYPAALQSSGSFSFLPPALWPLCHFPSTKKLQ